MKSQYSDDEVYYEAIRKALGQGNAAVMVGAGFSRNAEGGHQLSTWADIADELATGLSLDRVTDHKPFSTSHVTQLGEQYEQVFSKPNLETLLKRMIPDDRVAPGTLHESLLSLPWSEILTTNYDTLLERAADKIYERAHFTVCCREDIPISKVLGRRRVVKLHGSFPSQRPFIFTEEDYRTYPEKFAPFINLVRQSLLENVFCLIGFSGDDPNFLHWIGWVRDMLDKYALPVYLFLPTRPTLGQASLLKARGVTPVLLPQAPSGNEKDFAGRYAELFRQLSRPTQESPVKWGALKERRPEQAEQLDTPDSQYARFLRNIEISASLRKSYPGWIVAPLAVRERFRRSVSQFRDEITTNAVQERLGNASGYISAAVVGLHAWGTEILLEPLDDHIALFAIEVLQKSADLKLEGATKEDRDQLKLLFVDDEDSFNKQWAALALTVTRWARQGLHENTFRDLCRLLMKRFPDERQIYDSLQYEIILLSLHRGERVQAWDALQQWKITSTDPYMLVLRASLAADLGDLQHALSECMNAIFRLRELQKTDPNSMRLMSQEAWACVIASQLSHGAQFLKGGFEIKEDAQSKAPRFSERLEALASRGYAAETELEELRAELNAEALPPFVAKYKFENFDLGSTSQTIHFGQSSDLVSKIRAAFAWLELAERVGLMPRSKRIIYFSDSYMRSAWWIQYGDTSTRVLSILVRCINSDGLKPKDDSLLPHRTGWLSRYQVARLSATTAADMCGRFMQQILELLKLTATPIDQEQAVGFYVEVFSRLVIRVENPTLVLSWGMALVQIHKQPESQRNFFLWEKISTALVRVMEALPTQEQGKLLRAVADLPFHPPLAKGNVFDEYWVKPFNLLEHVWLDDLAVDVNEWRPVVQLALQELHATSSPYAWRKLVWLERLKVLQDEDKRSASEVLWQDVNLWPCIPGMYPAATFNWPARAGVNLDEAYLSWLQLQRLSSFSVNARQAPDGVKQLQWGFPSDDSYLRYWRFALQRKAWNLANFQAFLDEIQRWWSSEGEDVGQAYDRIDSLPQLLSRRADVIDFLMAEALLQAKERAQSEYAILRERVQAVREMFRLPKAQFFRVDVLLACDRNDPSTLDALQVGMMKTLLSDSEDGIAFVANAARWLLKNKSRIDGLDLERLIEGLISLAHAKRIPGLVWALGSLADFVSAENGKHMKDHSHDCELILDLLFDELSYEAREDGTGIVDGAVPLLRYQCARLATGLANLRNNLTPPVKRWLDAIKTDPLPELRFARFVDEA